MNRAEIEQAVLTEIHNLPLDKIEATLNFVLSLKNNPVKKRPLGLLKGKVDFTLDERDFAFDEMYNTKSTPTEGEKVLAILKKTGYLASMPDSTDLSENYKDHLDWGDKA
jgi:hypothetical protein